MKSALPLCALAFLVAQACGSDDDSKNVPGKQPPQGNAGEAAAGETSSGGTGGSGGTPSAGSGGTPSAGSGGAQPEAGAASVGGVPGTPSEGGTSSEGGTPSEGGSGGEATAAGAGGQAGALGEGGAGGASDGITCEVAPTCSGTLANLGTGDFSISFELTTSTAVRSGVVSQRSVCMRGKFWDIRLRPVDAGTSSFSIEFDDGASYTSFVAKTPASLNDGTPHDVRVCRKAGTVHAFADGVLIGSAPSKAAFTTLPALTPLTTHCTPYDGTVKLVGSVEDVCVGAL